MCFLHHYTKINDYTLTDYQACIKKPVKGKNKMTVACKWLLNTGQFPVKTYSWDHKIFVFKGISGYLIKVTANTDLTKQTKCEPKQGKRSPRLQLLNYAFVTFWTRFPQQPSTGCDIAVSAPFLSL